MTEQTKRIQNQVEDGTPIIKLVACGLTDAQIANRMYISEGAVKSRLKLLYDIIGAYNRAHAVAIMHAKGLLTEADIRQAYKARKPKPHD